MCNKNLKGFLNRINKEKMYYACSAVFGIEDGFMVFLGMYLKRAGYVLYS